MENSYLTILDFEIGFNFNIFEIGIVNLILTIILVAIYLINNLPADLKQRKDTIVKKIEDAETKLYEAEERLKYLAKQFSQVGLVARYLRNQSLTTKKKLLNDDLVDAKINLKIQFERAFNIYFSKERIVFLDIKKNVIGLIFIILISGLKENFKKYSQSTLFISKMIDELALKKGWV